LPCRSGGEHDLHDNNIANRDTKSIVTSHIAIS
jgi:hypothetical protein